MAFQPAAAKPAPDTVIDSGPSGSSNSASGTFNFHSTQLPATFSCKLDSAAATACNTGSLTFSNLSAGTHTFSVTATANGIADSSPATRTWTIDTTAPSAPTGLKATATSAGSVALTWTAGTDNVGVTGNQIFRDGKQLTTVGAVTSYTDSTAAPATSYSYTVVAVDGAGNQSAATAAASATTPAAPDTVIDTAPSTLTNSSSASISFHSTVSGATFTCSLDGGAATSCTSPKTYTNLGNALHKVSVTAIANGQADPTPATASWTVDTTPPTVPSGLQSVASSSGVQLTWTASTDKNGVSGYDVLRGGSVLASVGPTTTYTDTTIQTGRTYTYTVRAKDAAGNVSAPSTATTATPTADFDPHLTRAPYLTDLVGLHVAINFATDQSLGAGSTASAQWGAVGTGGSCTLSNTVAATRRNLLVGTVNEYQWKVALDLPTTGSYCYRVFLNGTDLLGNNASPTFTTQVQPGATGSFTFDVFGDWGTVDGNGQNQGQADLMQQIAASGARFAVTVGDNGYPNGSQINYGDLQQTGSGTSAIFGKNFWTVPGMQIPLFAAPGNHGLAGIAHTDINTWTEDSAVSTSNGRYQNDTYCCVNGTASANYGSEWYAFTAGNARFYVLDSAWGDTNTGTGSPYANDALAHFAPGTPEYTWLLNDLQTHPTQLKFAFSHYPIYSDNSNATLASDTYLQGATNLEGVLGSHGVQIVFNGHSHVYERNTASASGMPITYVTGGGGALAAPSTDPGSAVLNPISSCTATDAYGIGWSPTTQQGSACGAAAPPTSGAQVLHFLKVTVSGTTVTVAPTDSTGHVFDSKTYTFKVPTDTYIDSGPPAGTTATTATFTFHASGSPATYSCKLDSGTATTCTSPVTYSQLGQGVHTFSVAATVNSSKDPTPALQTWTIDSTPPAQPTGVNATGTSPFSVKVDWSPATDNTGVTGYLVYRDGIKVATVTNATSWIDYDAHASTTYNYTVLAQDVAGNNSVPSAPASVTTDPAPQPVFSDGFESGDLSAWGASHGLVVESASTHTGGFAAEGNTTTGNVYAKKSFATTYPDAYARVAFDVVAQPNQVDLVRLRDAAGNSLGYAYIETTGQLGWHNDAQATNTLSQLAPSPGWHVLEVHYAADAPGTTTGAVQIWLDGAPVDDLSNTSLDVGSAPVGSLQIGEVQTAQTYDVIFDDVAFGTARLGPYADTTPPSAPTGLTATPNGAFEANLSWTAATDDVGVTGYDISRDGTVVDSVGADITSYTDDSTSPGDHVYEVRATDASGNDSPWSTSVTVTQPAAVSPLFADGFETGDLSAWKATGAVTVENTDAHAGTWAAEVTPGGVANLKKTLSANYADGYARVAFKVMSQSSQVQLLRLRDNAGASIAYVYLTNSDKLALHLDNGSTGSTDFTGPAVAAGWHSVEMRLNTATGATQVWLDGNTIAALSLSGAALGSAPIGALQLGDSATTANYDVRLDDAAFSTSRIGVGGDTTPPSAPASLQASAGAFSVGLSWTAASDDVGVTGYDLLRNGVALTSLPGDATSYTDSSVLASTQYSYTLRARDAAGNVSGFASVLATTAAANSPIFADGFETGDVSAWSASTGLTPEQADVHGGTWAAEGNVAGVPAYARKTLSTSYADAYARVAFNVVSQGGKQLTLLRLRDTPTGTGGYLFLTSGGNLAFRSDALATATVSSVSPAPGWHSVELHLVLGTSGTVEVWLDGASVPDLTIASMNLGTSPFTVFQIGDTANVTADLRLDDAAFSTSRLGVGGDTTAPAAPTQLTATPQDGFTVGLTWTASTDDVGVAGYDLLRNGAPLASLPGDATSYTDSAALDSTTYNYQLRARDAAGNVSTFATTTVTTPAADKPLFADGFEAQDLSSWTSASGVTVESTAAHTGTWAAEAAAAGAAANLRKTLPSTYSDGYARVAFTVLSQTSQIQLVRLRDSGGKSIGYLYVTTGGNLALHLDNATGSTDPTGPSVAAGWHSVELRFNITNGVTQVWLDGVAVSAMSLTNAALGTASIGGLQIGDTTGVTYDVRYDDAAFSTSRIGLGGDVTAPTTPDSFSANPNDGFSVALGWTAASDDVGVVGYDLFRNGTLLTSLPATATFYVDTTVAPSTTYSYSLRARDAAGNVSTPATASATTLAAATPLFADGFETGDLSAWTASTGLTPTSLGTHAGGWSVEGNAAGLPAYARKTLPAPYTDAYARVAFKVVSQGGQVTLLRLRDSNSGSTDAGYLYLTSGGSLAFHNDALKTNIVSALTPSSGWHSVELHLLVNGTASSVQVWLDGISVPALSAATTTLGAVPLAVLQLGDTGSPTADIVYDDAAFSTSRIGVGGDTTAPSQPGSFAASATDPFTVAMSWTASTDDVGVTGYDLLRNGVVLATLPATATSYTDSAALASTSYTYNLRARDAANNVSVAATANLTTPDPAPVAFADGFESGDLSAWTGNTGFAVENTDTHAATAYAAEANATGTAPANLQKTLPATYSDIYARVAVKVAAQTSQVTLMRLRPTGSTSDGYVYLRSGGKLALHLDSTGTSTASDPVGPALGTGWHSVEVHFNIAAGTTQVWLDGNAVPALSLTTAALGSGVTLLQVGDTAKVTYDVLIDDVAVSTARIGIGPVTTGA